MDFAAVKWNTEASSQLANEITELWNTAKGKSFQLHSGNVFGGSILGFPYDEVRLSTCDYIKIVTEEMTALLSSTVLCHLHIFVMVNTENYINYNQKWAKKALAVFNLTEENQTLWLCTIYITKQSWK